MHGFRVMTEAKLVDGPAVPAAAAVDAVAAAVAVVVVGVDMVPAKAAVALAVAAAAAAAAAAVVDAVADSTRQGGSFLCRFAGFFVYMCCGLAAFAPSSRALREAGKGDWGKSWSMW